MKLYGSVSAEARISAVATVGDAMRGGTDKQPDTRIFLFTGVAAGFTTFSGDGASRRPVTRRSGRRMSGSASWDCNGPAGQVGGSGSGICGLQCAGGSLFPDPKSVTRIGSAWTGGLNFLSARPGPVV
ncbi:MAG: hypothetical protein OEW16_10125 [Gammaproteobacteria bacterium]|nr:hypothetical protein [Gammaproteobacteria bacterium]